MTVGAPTQAGGRYWFDGTTWRGHTLTPHVPNPLPGRTTHVWDEQARTFGVAPLHPLPAMPTFYPDGTQFTGANAIVADDIAAAGDTLTQIVAKAKALATNASTLYTLVLSAKTYVIRGFTDGLNVISGVDMPPNVQLWGAGSGRHGGPVTTIRLEPHTSAYDLTNCTWTGSYGTPKLHVIRAAKTLPGWGIRHLRIECGKQGTDNNGRGHPYNGVRFEECSGKVIAENLVIRGTRGWLPYPPGETGHLITYKCPDVIIRNIELDGRELGNESTAISNRVSTSGVMINETSGVMMDVTYRYSLAGGPLALWWSRGFTTFNLEARDVGGGINSQTGQTMGAALVNQERVHRATHYSGRATLHRLDQGIPNLQYTLNNDQLWDDATGGLSSTTGVPGTCLLVDAANDATSDVYDRITVQTWHPYDPMSEGAGHSQRNSATSGPAWAVDRRGRVVTLSMNNADGSWQETSAVRTP